MTTIKKLIIATVLATALGPVSVYAMDQEQEPEEAAAAQTFTKEQANVKLLEAANSGDIDGVKQALAAGADVNQADADIWHLTPLYWAVNNGNAEIVNILIAVGANVNQGDGHGAIPLIHASTYGETVAMLIDVRAAVNQGNADRLTPLYFAAVRGYSAIVKALVFNGARLSGNELDKMTAVSGQAQNTKAVIRQAQEARQKVLQALGEQKQLEHCLKALPCLPVPDVHNICMQYAAPYCQDPFLEQMIVGLKKGIEDDQRSGDRSRKSRCNRGTCVLL